MIRKISLAETVNADVKAKNQTTTVASIPVELQKKSYSNLTMNNLKANYLTQGRSVSFGKKEDFGIGSNNPLDEAKKNANLSDIPTDENYEQMIENLRKESDAKRANAMRKLLLASVPYDTAYDLKKPYGNPIKGNFYEKLSDGLAILLSNNKNVILEKDKGVDNEIFLQMFTNKVKADKYYNSNLSKDINEFFYIENPLTFADVNAQEKLINSIPQESLLDLANKNFQGLKIKLNPIGKINPSEEFLNRLDLLNKDFERNGKFGYVFVNNLDDVLDCPVKSNYHTPGEYLKNRFQALNIIGIRDKKTTNQNTNMLLEISDFFAINTKDFAKLNLKGLSIGETEDYFKLNPDIIEDTLNQYTNVIINKVSPNAMKKIIAKAATTDEALPNSALNLLTQITSGKLISKEKMSLDEGIKGIKINKKDCEAFEDKYEKLLNISKNPDVNINLIKSKITMDDLAGCNNAKEELKDAIEFMTNPKSFLAKGRKPSGGYLFSGPPGTGKTEMALALANEVKKRTGKEIPVFQMTDFGDKYINSGANAVNKSYDDAIEYARKVDSDFAIMFIDEADRLCRKISDSSSNGEDAKATNALKERMAGIEAKTSDVKVITIAATNHPEVFDNALLRSERFTQIDFKNLEKKDDIFKLLQVHSKKKPFASEEAKTALLKEMADEYTGLDLSGDKLSKILDESTRLAYKTEQKVITKGIVTDAFSNVLYGKISEIDCKPEDKVLASVHEAGHAENALNELIGISNEPRGQALAMTIVKPRQSNYDFKSLINELACDHGGEEAEKLINKSSQGGVSGDFKNITSIINMGIKRCGLGIYTPRMSFYDSANQEIEELSKEYSKELRADMELLNETSQRISKSRVQFMKDFLLGPYKKANEDAIKQGKFGQNYTKCEYLEFRKQWLDKTGLIKAEPVLNKGVDTMMDIAFNDKFWTQNANVKNARNIMMDAVEDIINYSKTPQWIQDSSKTTQYLTSKLQEIADFADADKAKAWLKSINKEKAETLITKKVNEIVVQAKKQAPTKIGSLLKKLSTVI